MESPETNTTISLNCGGFSGKLMNKDFHGLKNKRNKAGMRRMQAEY
jgi:hypothetical protein